MVTVYSTNPPCPKCRVLEKKFDELGIEYKVIDDVEKIKAKGYGDRYMPLVEAGGQILEFADAVKWANKEGD